MDSSLFWPILTFGTLVIFAIILGISNGIDFKKFQKDNRIIMEENKQIA